MLIYYELASKRKLLYLERISYLVKSTMRELFYGKSHCVCSTVPKYLSKMAVIYYNLRYMCFSMINRIMLKLFVS